MDSANLGHLAVNAINSTWLAFLSVWRTPGTSEFFAALVGGSMTLWAQRWALAHDREKEDARRADEQKARAWSMFFKIHHVLEATTALADSMDQARGRANELGEALWQTLQFPPHDWDKVDHNNEELLLLIEHKQLDIMQRYQEAMVWISSLIQSVKMYRDMRIEFLSNTPSDMSDTFGTLTIDENNKRLIMPKIVHLKTLSESLEKVLLERKTEMVKLTADYIVAMQAMVGQSPELEMPRQKEVAGVVAPAER